MTLEIVEDKKPSEQLIVAVKASGLELESAQSLLTAFQPLLEQAEDWRKKTEQLNVTDISQVREMKLARESRLALREIRIAAEKTRKQLKEDSLRRGKAIDGVYNVIEFIIAPLEKRLLEQEKFVENKETERKAALKRAREEQLHPFGINPDFYKLDEMPEETYRQLFESSRLSFETARLAALKAEQDRIAAEAAVRAEQERVRQENERLKKEAAEKEEAARQERLREQALREVERQKEAAVRAELEAKAHEEADRRRKLEEAVASAERIRKAKEAEEARKAKEAADAEARRMFEEEKARREAARKAKLAPDKEKIRAYVSALRATPTPELADESLQGDMDGAVEQVLSYLDELSK